VFLSLVPMVIELITHKRTDDGMIIAATNK
jgi:hypothetical protein